MTDNSFSALYRNDSRILILGSLPGKRSIAEQQYYAHPRNAFWSILELVTGVSADEAYSVRVDAALDAQIALWDMVAQAVRSGSLDSDIRKETVLFNPIDELLLTLPRIEKVILNGGEAARLFKRAGFDKFCQAQNIEWVQLPSTSPAHASLSLEGKRERWLSEF